MKRASLVFATMLTILSMVAAAQLSTGRTIMVNVPFKFVVGNKVMPAGECTLKWSATGARTLIIRNSAANAATFASASPAETDSVAGEYALVFHKYGNHYFLSAMKLEGSRITYRLPESEAEAELRAQNAPVSQEILLASGY